MLEPRHILRLILNRERLLAHSKMPPPGYVKKPLTGQFAAIGEATIGELLDIPPDIFQMQLRAARDFGASYVGQDKNNRVIGVSATTSLIKWGDLLHKNMILPQDLLRSDPRLDAHYVVSVFLRGSVINGTLPAISEVEVAGWASTQDIARTSIFTKPESFESKLPIVMYPCIDLNPISGLVESLNEPHAQV